MEILLTGKNALVGGSSKGIGRAIAERLAASGANVTLMARSKDLMAQIVASLPTDKGQSHGYLVVNFSDFPAYKAQMDAFVACFAFLWFNHPFCKCIIPTFHMDE